MLQAWAREAPEAPALLAPGRAPLAYGPLFELLEATRAGLARAGVGPEDRVALVLPPGPEAATAFLGVAACATAAPLNPAYGARELEFYLGDLDARALVTPVGQAGAARGVARDLGIPVLELTPGEAAGAFRLDEGGPGDGEPRGSEGDAVALALHTSGTTSRPKLVPLTHANLLASARQIAATLALTPEDRCLGVMPLFHIHGLVASTLATLAAGGSLVCPPGFLAPRVLDWLDEFRPTWLTAVPTMHQAILARARQPGARARLPRLRFLRSSSASLPPSLLRDLEETFACPVVEAYGMTEASHQIASNQLPPGRRRAGTVGVASGPEVAVVDAAGTRLAAGQVGEVVLRGPGVCRGYAGAPEATAAAFFGDWFRTGDQGHLDEEGVLTLTGRLKELINRGGEKISPREIDEVLLEHPAVRQAVAFAMPHPSLGEDVAAAVVLHPGQAADERDLREHVAARLAPFKVPARLVLVDAIPMGPTGKLQRLGLAAALGVEAGEAPPVTPAPGGTPAAGLEAELVALFRSVLEDGSLGPTDTFLAAGGDSVLAVSLLERANARYGARLSLLDLFDADATPRALAAKLAAPRAPAPGTGSEHG